MRRPLAAALCLMLAACGTTYMVPEAGQVAGVAPLPVRDGPGRSPADFRRVAARIEPAAEAFCREEAQGAPAGLLRLPHRAGERPAHAAQRLPDPGAQRPAGGGGQHQPAREMRSDDEIAFVLAHEAAHHVAQHIPKQQRSQALGALLLGGIAQASAGPAGISDQALQEAMQVGAFVGGRAYSQNYELEADWLGAFIAARGGYEPARGAQIFARPALASSGGPVILSTHPASPRRVALAAEAAAEIRRQQAAGLTPRPAYAGRGLF